MEDPSNPRHKDYVVLYGHFPHDAKRRAVGIAVSHAEAKTIEEVAVYTGTMPEVEVESRRWFHVLGIS